MKVPMHEFTAAEIFEALRVGMPDADARRLADHLAQPVDMDAILADPPQNQNGPGVPYWSIPTINFSTDTLILLSLVSASTAAKVDRYRAEMRAAGAIKPQDDDEWQRRRDQIAGWRDEELRRREDSEADPDTPAT